MSDVISLAQKFASFDEQWSPKIVAQMNDNHFKIAKISGDFIWHSHEDTDEVFIVIDGKLFMDFRDRTVELNPGEMIVVPSGVEHKPRCDSECQILMVEKAGTVNTGGVTETETEATTGEWI